MRKATLLLLSLLLFCGCTKNPEPSGDFDYTALKKSSYSADPSVKTYYEIFVASFADGDGDGKGDLKGVTAKLDYLEALGINGIWLMPIHPSPSYHKYDVTDYYQIDPAYGSLEDFKVLLKKAHEKGISVIIDLVINHTSDQHPWFEDMKQAVLNGDCSKSAYCDWYVLSESNQTGYSPLGNLYYEARFWSGMPDLNLDNPEVRAEIEKITAFWLDLGVDGFRLDATTSYYPSNYDSISFLTWFMEMVKSQKSDVFVVGETWSDQAAILSYFRSGIDCLFDFPDSGPDGYLINVLRSGNGKALAEHISAQVNNIDANQNWGNFLSNHDQGRSGGYVADEAQQKMLANLYLLRPGVAFLYYGEEIELKGSGEDPNKRLPMVWDSDQPLLAFPTGASQSEYYSIDVKRSLQNEDSLLRHYASVIHLRNSLSPFGGGSVTVLSGLDEALCAFIITNESEWVIVVHNLKSEAKSMSLPGNYALYGVIEIEGSITYKDGILSFDGLGSAVIIEAKP
ncbi:MAG: hypothetical protein LBR25_01900 [Erysipelotrichaceae bacterium]|jgi:alpha-amylase|nr:hypothetical protein [Erysipelotrichaceae bacterium]